MIKDAIFCREHGGDLYEKETNRNTYDNGNRIA